MMQYVTKEGSTREVTCSTNDLFDSLRDRIAYPMDMAVAYREFAKIAPHPNILFRDTFGMDSSQLGKLLGAGLVHICFAVQDNIDVFLSATTEENAYYICYGIDEQHTMSIYLFRVTESCFNALTRSMWMREFLDDYIETL